MPSSKVNTSVPLHQHQKPTRKYKELLLQVKERSNKCDFSSLQKAPKEFADLAHKRNKSTIWDQQQKKKMLFRFGNPVIKIISSQELIGRITPPFTNRWTIYGTLSGQKYGGIPQTVILQVIRHYLNSMQYFTGSQCNKVASAESPGLYNIIMSETKIPSFSKSHTFIIFVHHNMHIHIQ